jgi:nucleoid-associated protein YgaU
MQLRRTAASALLVVADAAVLVGARPDLRRVGLTVGHPRAAAAAFGVDGALGPVVTALLWVAAAWLAFGLLAAAAARLPGAPGRWGIRAGRALLPRALSGLVAGSVGAGVFLAPAAALAAGPSAPPRPPAAGAATVASPSTPATPSTPASPSPPATPSTPATTPTTAAAAEPSPAWPVQPASTPAPVWPTGPSTAAGPPPAGPARSTGSGPVTVGAGDSLWTIAGRRLGSSPSPARIAAAWPRWFAANRAVIGADPDLIHPGQVLRPPADAAEVGP